jgi:hypothetical protein
MPLERTNLGFGFTRAHSAGRAQVGLLLVGTPGTGKRAVGHYLAEARGFVHLDFGHSETREELLGLGDAELRARLGVYAAEAPGVVITWGAGDVEQLAEIRRLRSVGVEPVWLDSDRGAACRAHYADARRLPRFRFVDTFEADGSFRSVEAVARELVAPPRRRLPRPRPVRLTPRVADAAAFLVGAAAATAGVLVAVAGLTSGHPNAPVAAGANIATANRVAALPRAGVLVTGSSLAGIHLGDTMAEVRALWGSRFTRCCAPGTWFYVYPPPSDPVGAAVEFRGGRVVAVYTLGEPTGWHTETGIRVGQIIDNPPAAKGPSTSEYVACAGYGAKSTRSASGAVTSILTQGASVYGFALTVPSVSPCH